MNEDTAFAVMVSAFFIMLGLACLATHSAEPLWCLVIVAIWLML